MNRLGVAALCLVLMPLGSSRSLSGESWIATVAGGIPTQLSWACSADGVALRWSSATESAQSRVGEFIAACDPALDASGRTLLFSGRRSLAEGFRIWSVDRNTLETRALSPEGLEARGPFVLPDGSIVFIGNGDLYRSGLESDSVEQLTFTRGRVQSAAVLPDGRIIILERSSPQGRLFTMLPDGTWTTVWPGLDDLDVSGFAAIDRDLLLVLDSLGDLWKVAIADPYAPRQRVPVDLGGALTGLFRAEEGGAFLVAEIGGKSGGHPTRAAALRFEPELRLSEIAALDDTTVLAVQSAAPGPQSDPLPSIVKPELDTGFLFVIDVGRTDDPELAGLARHEVAELRVYRLEETGSRTELFAVEPAADGSVYLEAPADTPLVLEMVDGEGAVLARSRTPIWVRPNERRGCIGCHVSPAYAPPNIRPEALVHEPHRLGAESGAPR